MENTFDLKKFLVENKLTSNSRLVEEASKEQVEKQVFDFINTPEVGALVDKAIAKLDPKAKQQVASKLQAIAEGASDDFAQSKKFAEKGLQIVQQDSSLDEMSAEDQAEWQKRSAAMDRWAAEHDFGHGVPAAFIKTLGKVLDNLGVINMMSMGMLPAIAAAASDYFAGTNIIPAAAALIGSGTVAAGLSVVAGLVGGMLLWRIGKALQGEEVTGSTPLFQ